MIRAKSRPQEKGLSVPLTVLDREQLVALGLAVAMFLITSLSLVIPEFAVGIVALGLPLYQAKIVRNADDWAIHEIVFGVWLLLLAFTIIVTPAWGIPLLVLTGGVKIVEALGDVGLAIDLFLLGILAYSRNTPDWAVAVLIVIALGELLFVYRDYRQSGPSDHHTPS